MRSRIDFGLIASWIGSGARVLDLGCGPGLLLRNLADRKSCRVEGVEMDPQAHVEAVRAGVPVLQLDIDKDLGIFRDDSYDVVILSRTLQAVRYPAAVLRQMMRIAPVGIVSMPNFAYWRNRLRLLAGHAPVSKDLPYSWHDSPNLHFGSCADLEELFAKMDLRVAKAQALSAAGRISSLPFSTRNWSAGAVVYELRRPGAGEPSPASAGA